jgi:hypothetical protein
VTWARRDRSLLLVALLLVALGTWLLTFVGCVALHRCTVQTVPIAWTDGTLTLLELRTCRGGATATPPAPRTRHP